MTCFLSTRDLLPSETKSSNQMDADDDYDVLGSPGIEVDEIDNDAQGDEEGAFISLKYLETMFKILRCNLLGVLLNVLQPTVTVLNLMELLWHSGMRTMHG